MLEGLKTRCSLPAARPWIGASLLISLAAVACLAFSSSSFPYRRCPASDAVPAARLASPPATDLSHIVFAIGASSKTWERRRGYSELWWRPGETRGHVWLDEPPKTGGTWPASLPPYRASSSDAEYWRRRYGKRADASRMARIAAEAYGLGLEGVRWFVMGDDDTVFFPENLAAVLGRYDHREMYYIGAPSESVEQDVMHSYTMAFGGGGFAVSYPAAAALAGAIDGCLDRYASMYGSDQRVKACFSELGVPLTREQGFHQVDLRGDAYGMLAAHPVAPVVSLHHLDYLKPVIPTRSDQMDAVRSFVRASNHDPARTLQQSFCYVREPGGFNWTVSVSWGYTVQVYPWVLAPRKLEVAFQTFRTWRSRGPGPFTFNTRSLPGPERPCERPEFYFLDRVRDGRNRKGSTVTDYAKYEERRVAGKGHVARCDRPAFAAAGKVQTVTVRAPKMDPGVWRKAPRRQCCEAELSRWWGKSMEVTIRDCYPGSDAEKVAEEVNVTFVLSTIASTAAVESTTTRPNVDLTISKGGDGSNIKKKTGTDKSKGPIDQETNQFEAVKNATTVLKLKLDESKKSTSSKADPKVKKTLRDQDSELQGYIKENHNRKVTSTPKKGSKN